MKLIEYVFLISLCISLIILNSPLIWKGLKEITNGREELNLKRITFGKKIMFWGLINILCSAILIIKFLIELLVVSTEYSLILLYISFSLIAIYLLSYLSLIFYYTFTRYRKF
jgi:hypothetical protein